MFVLVFFFNFPFSKEIHFVFLKTKGNARFWEYVKLSWHLMYAQKPTFNLAGCLPHFKLLQTINSKVKLSYSLQWPCFLSQQSNHNLFSTWRYTVLWSRRITCCHWIQFQLAFIWPRKWCIKYRCLNTQPDFSNYCFHAKPIIAQNLTGYQVIHSICITFMWKTAAIAGTAQK